jgi:hypothetical protein
MHSAIVSILVPEVSYDTGSNQKWQAFIAEVNRVQPSKQTTYNNYKGVWRLAGNVWRVQRRQNVAKRHWDCAATEARDLFHLERRSENPDVLAFGYASQSERSMLPAFFACRGMTMRARWATAVLTRSRLFRVGLASAAKCSR